MDEAMRLRVQRNAAHLPIGHRHGQCAGEERDGVRPPMAFRPARPVRAVVSLRMKPTPGAIEDARWWDVAEIWISPSSPEWGL